MMEWHEEVTPALDAAEVAAKRHKDYRPALNAVLRVQKGLEKLKTVNTRCFITDDLESDCVEEYDEKIPDRLPRLQLLVLQAALEDDTLHEEEMEDIVSRVLRKTS